MSRVTCSKDETVCHNKEEAHMLRWAVVFLIVAIIAAIFGFGNIAGTATEIAKILFYVFLVIFLVSIVMHLMGGKGPKLPGV